MLQLPPAGIDRRSPMPYYFQLKELLAEEINSGRWPVGEKLPSESELCRHFDVSRATVRQGLAQMENEGLVRPEKGRGTFVARPRSSWLIQSTASFHEEATRLGHDVRSRVLRCELAPLPDWAASALELPQRTTGVAIERVRSLDGRVVMYVQNYLPEDYAAPVLEADLERESLYGTLHRHGDDLVIGGGRRVLDAEAADEWLSGLLQIDPGTPVLFVESVSWNAALRPFECYRAWHITNRAMVEVHVLGQDAAERAGINATARGRLE